MTRVRRPPERRGVTGQRTCRGCRGDLASAPCRVNSYDLRVATGRRRTRAKDSDRNETCRFSTVRWPTVSSPSEEHRRRVATATTATTLGELQALVERSAERQRAGATAGPQGAVEAPGRRRRAGASGRRRRRAGSARHRDRLGPVRQHLSPLTSPPTPARSPTASPPCADPAEELQSLGGLTGLFEQMKTAVRRHLGLPAADLSGLRVAGPARPERRSPHAELLLPGGWDDPSTPRADATGSST